MASTLIFVADTVSRRGGQFVRRHLVQYECSDYNLEGILVIALLKGQVIDKRIDRVTILCGGLGLEFLATLNTLSILDQGQSAETYMCSVVCEDALTLCDFGDFQQHGTFQTLIQVKGVGPKLASAALAALGPSNLADAIASRDLTTS